MSEEIRQKRLQAQQDKISSLRARAADKMRKYEALDGAANRDGAFNTQPVPNNSRARSFINARNRERSKFDKAMRLYQEAQTLCAEADRLEDAGVRVAGDAAREAAIITETMDVNVGDVVSSVYGLRRVTKVNAKSVKIEAATGDIMIAKHLIKVVKRT